METFPLHSISLEEAKQKQFRLIDEVTKVFEGHEMLSRGDLGLAKGLNQPLATSKVEKIIANFFHAEKAILVRGSGTSAIRYALFSGLKAGDTLLIHDAPVYPTTETSIQMIGLKTIRANYNSLIELEKVIKDHPEIKGVLVQFTRQKIDDRYDFEEVVKIIKANTNAFIIGDDNYAVMKVSKIGVESGTNLSCFSCFKLLGPEGIGCVVGDAKYIDIIKKFHYSGGMQVQGHEAMDVLKGLIFAPVLLSIQAEVNEELVVRLNKQEVKGVKHAFLANAQSKVLIVELDKENAQDVILAAQKLGAAPYPVGAESQYELVPMFYRVSGTFLESDPTLLNKMIRINPLRSGPDTIIRILKQAIENSK